MGVPKGASTREGRESRHRQPIARVRWQPARHPAAARPRRRCRDPARSRPVSWAAWSHGRAPSAAARCRCPRRRRRRCWRPWRGLCRVELASSWASRSGVAWRRVWARGPRAWLQVDGQANESDGNHLRRRVQARTAAYQQQSARVMTLR